MHISPKILITICWCSQRRSCSCGAPGTDTRASWWTSSTAWRTGRASTTSSGSARTTCKRSSNVVVSIHFCFLQLIKACAGNLVQSKGALGTEKAEGCCIGTLAYVAWRAVTTILWRSRFQLPSPHILFQNSSTEFLKMWSWLSGGGIAAENKELMRYWTRRV
jgi:hypothetical protein